MRSFGCVGELAQPLPAHERRTDGILPRLAARRGYRLVLVNFGCGGATTTSLIENRGCSPVALGPGGRAYPGRTQLAAAERFLRAHRRRTALVSVSIGGNE
jgi:hypothetical protein